MKDKFKKDENNVFIFNQKAIKYLADVINNTNLTEIEYKCNDISIRLSKQTASPYPFIQQPSLQNNAQHIAQSTQTEQKPDNISQSFITAPIIGRAYLSPKPGDAPFVKIGDTITQGQVIFIIEAMKVMNNIKADKSGIVEEILVKDGSPVEYGQKLLTLK